MLNTMERRKKIANIFGGLAITFMFAACVEGQDGGITAWNIISLLVAFACGWISKWVDENVVITKKEEEPEEEENDEQPGQE